MALENLRYRKKKPSGAVILKTLKQEFFGIIYKISYDGCFKKLIYDDHL